jgi:aspartate 1-decarboxylase
VNIVYYGAAAAVFIVGLMLIIANWKKMAVQEEALLVVVFG